MGGKIRKTKTKGLAWKKETQEENNHQHSQKEVSEPHHDRVAATGYIHTLALNTEKKTDRKIWYSADDRQYRTVVSERRETNEPYSWPRLKYFQVAMKWEVGCSEGP